MERPGSFLGVTVAEARDEYRKNVKRLDNILLLTKTGCLNECMEFVGESLINEAITRTIIQQEYIREREKANWGWEKRVVDFSKGSILKGV